MCFFGVSFAKKINFKESLKWGASVVNSPTLRHKHVFFFPSKEFIKNTSFYHFCFIAHFTVSKDQSSRSKSCTPFCFIQLNRQNTDWIVVKSCSSLTFCVCITKGSSSFDNWIGLIVLQFKRLIDKTMGTKSKLDFMGCFAMAFFFLVGRLSLFQIA